MKYSLFLLALFFISNIAEARRLPPPPNPQAKCADVEIQQVTPVGLDNANVSSCVAIGDGSSVQENVLGPAAQLAQTTDLHFQNMDNQLNEVSEEIQSIANDFKAGKIDSVSLKQRSVSSMNQSYGVRNTSQCYSAQGQVMQKSLRSTERFMNSCQNILEKRIAELEKEKKQAQENAKKESEEKGEKVSADTSEQDKQIQEAQLALQASAELGAQASVLSAQLQQSNDKFKEVITNSDKMADALNSLNKSADQLRINDKGDIVRAPLTPKGKTSKSRNVVIDFNASSTRRSTQVADNIYIDRSGRILFTQ